MQRHVATLAASHDVDILMLAECEIGHAELATELNSGPGRIFQVVEGPRAAARIYTRLPFLRPVFGSVHLSVCRLALPGCDEILLAVVHLPSQLHLKPADQHEVGVDLARTILDQEEKIGHSRTVLVGDFNMNPFDDGMIGHRALHSVMSRAIASRGKRVVQGQSSPFFYNPMWSRFGDASPGPSGTYYYHKGRHLEYFWNIFDQVLLRPDLLNRFDVGRLSVPTAAGGVSLLDSQGRPDKAGASDHLPIVFELDI